MSAKDALNEPVKVLIAGNEYKVREAAVLAVAAIVEDYIQNAYIDKMNKVAATIKDKEDRAVYLSAESDKIPVGLTLQQLATDMMVSGNIPNTVAVRVLHAGLVKDQPELTEEDAGTLFTTDGAASNEALKLVLGSKKERTPAGTRSSKSRKSTAGRRT